MSEENLAKFWRRLPKTLTLPSSATLKSIFLGNPIKPQTLKDFVKRDTHKTRTSKAAVVHRW